ncbi:hypothetical protein EVAR_20519_1 [Eumeta japonica]|uniref:Uncharacterized protein n=1 Tax=Eumeta variegata TaxID=151549 RepID=A0A4C1VL63_EUMVA|nr:hypothetical protein EVAR_20519_1 [Eumeta japonica]
MSPVNGHAKLKGLYPHSTGAHTSNTLEKPLKLPTSLSGGDYSGGSHARLPVKNNILTRLFPRKVQGSYHPYCSAQTDRSPKRLFQELLLSEVRFNNSLSSPLEEENRVTEEWALGDLTHSTKDNNENCYFIDVFCESVVSGLSRRPISVLQPTTAWINHVDYEITLKSSLQVFSNLLNTDIKLCVILRHLCAESSNLSNIEHRAVIKYFVKKGKRQRNFEDMVSVLQESAPSYTMVKNGLAYFNKDERAVKMILAQGVL